MSENSEAKRVIDRLKRMEPLRQVHETTWRECYEMSFPDRAGGLDGGEPLTADDSKAKRAKLFDSTATDACRLLMSNVLGGMTPANSRWFSLVVNGDEQQAAAGSEWLDDAANFVWRNIHASNYDAEAGESVLDGVVAGWFATYIDAADDGGYVFESWPIDQLYVSASKPGGMIDIVYRKYSLTAAQAVAAFDGKGGGNLGVSEKVREAAEKNPNEPFEFLWAIEPRASGVKSGSNVGKHLPVASIQVECGSRRVVRESGYHEMPVVVPRWRKLKGSFYAVGPMFDALPDAKTLNQLVSLTLAAADIAVSGMWIAEDDGVLNPRTVKVGARKIIVANSVDSMKPLTTGANFNVSDMLVTKLQAAIRKVLMADQLQPQDGPAMTATEVNVRVSLIRQLLGPLYGRLQAEWLVPMVERCFGLALRAGMLGPVPQELGWRELSVKFISPLARAQMLEEVSAIDQFMTGQIEAAQAFPQALDVVDIDEAGMYRGKALGVPHKVVRNYEELSVFRKSKAQAQAQAEQAAAESQTRQYAGQKMIDAAAAQAGA